MKRTFAFLVVVVVCADVTLVRSLMKLPSVLAGLEKDISVRLMRRRAAFELIREEWLGADSAKLYEIAERSRLRGAIVKDDRSGHISIGVVEFELRGGRVARLRDFNEEWGNGRE